MKLPKDFQGTLQDTFKRSWLPALAGAAGTGTVAGYLAHRDHSDPRETPAQRRKRILRTALIGAALGGTAGAAIPAGLSLSVGHASGHPGMIESGLDKAFSAGAHYALPGAVGAAGAMGIHKHRQARQHAMRDSILGRIKGKGDVAHFHGGRTAKTPGHLRDLVALDPEAVGEMEKRMQRHMPVPAGGAAGTSGNKYQVADWFNEAGFKDPEALEEAGPGAGRLFGVLNGHRLSGQVRPTDAKRLALASWLREQGPVSKLVSKLMTSEGADGAMALRKPIQIAGRSLEPAELGPIYRRLVRPSLGRVPYPVQLGLLGAGILGANHLQRRMEGA